MEDKLKDRFKSFEDLPTPPKGHEERFIDRLVTEAERKASPPRWRNFAVYAAAAAVVILLINVVVVQIGNENEQVAKRTLADVSMQTSQIETQLKEQVSIRKEKIDESDPAIQEHIQRYKELETEFERLEEALNTDYGNRHVIEALIKNYQMRIRILEQIILEKRLRSKEKSEGAAPIQS